MVEMGSNARAVGLSMSVNESTSEEGLVAASSHAVFEVDIPLMALPSEPDRESGPSSDSVCVPASFRLVASLSGTTV